MSSEIMFDLDTSPVLTRATLCRSASGTNVSDHAVPPNTDSRCSWSLPSSPVSTTRRQVHTDFDTFAAASALPTRQSPKRPSYMTLPSFARSYVPLSSAFTSNHAVGLQHGDATYIPAARHNSKANSEDAYRPLSSHSSFLADMMAGATPSSPSRFPFGMFPDLATSPVDLNAFPFCHFEQVHSPSAGVKEADGVTSPSTPGSDNYIVAGCLLSGCHGHEPTHDQDGHPSPAVWTPTSLAAMRKRWRNMRKQPPAQTAVPLRPCLKKMSHSATATDMCGPGTPPDRPGRSERIPSSSSLSSSSTAFDDAGEDRGRLAPLDTDLAYAAMTVAEWSAVSGTRSRSTSGSSSTMLFSPFPSDYERQLEHELESGMPCHFHEEELTEVEEYMMQGFLQAFQKSDGAVASVPDDVPAGHRSVSVEGGEEDLGSTPRPASTLNRYVADQNETIRQQSHPRRSSISFDSHEVPTSSIVYESPKTIHSEMMQSESLAPSKAIIDGLADLPVLDTLTPVLPSTEFAKPIAVPRSRLSLIDSDAEIDGEWQWACPITVPLPVRGGLSTVFRPVSPLPLQRSTSVTPHQSCHTASTLPSRSNSVTGSSASAACEKRRVHFPVCPGGTGEMALCALYPTYSATDYDRTPLEPPSEEERNCRMPERGSRFVVEDDTSCSNVQAGESLSAIFDRGVSQVNLEQVDDQQVAWNSDADEYCWTGRYDETAAALTWSCSNALSGVSGDSREPCDMDDNWEEWLDRRKTSCNITSSSSADTLKATTGESWVTSDSLLTPTNTPQAQSPLHSPRVNVYGDEGEVPFYTKPGSRAGPYTCSMQPRLEQEDTSAVSDAPSLANTASSGECSTTQLDTVKDVHISAHSADLSNDSGDMQAWLPHANNRKKDFSIGETSSEISSNTSAGTSTAATVTTNSIPKLKKKKKGVSSEKRTTLWTQSQSTWGQFGSDSWSTGEEGCLGGF
ncbi:hypothetical protein QFC22_003031 [Naganishia vaughanmartiniae]|uniref:Uncharacterized protein n=1 Tax=Naganishia vaughanmartiniae TaxID=1424756 RepID=A0ACC2X8K8_9TREE|nr:hypothetical protein QFC22_003031 [Naganishia vaughanmartiniae]